MPSVKPSGDIRFAPLAAGLLPSTASACRSASCRATSLPKTRVRGSRRQASGRISRRRSQALGIATGCGRCRYKSASGRRKWPSRDPIKEKGGPNLFAFVSNNPVGSFDPLGMASWPPIVPPSVPYSPPYQAPRDDPHYPQGFARCQRDTAVDGWDDIIGKCCNSFGGDHTYLQFVNRPHPPEEGPEFRWGWGFSGGDTTKEDKALNPSRCVPCERTGNPLKYGEGARYSKTSRTATDAEIRDCIMHRPPTRRYFFPIYVCTHWADEAATDCGLSCD